MIADDLERLAERGPHHNPDDVVASALAESDAAYATASRRRAMAVAAASVLLIAGVVASLVARSGGDPVGVTSSPTSVGEPYTLLALSSIVDGDELVATDLPDGWEIGDAELGDGMIRREFRDPARDAAGSVSVGFGNVDRVDPEGELRRLGGVDWYVTVQDDRSTTYTAVGDDVFLLVGGSVFDPAELDQFVAGLRAGRPAGETDRPGGDDVNEPADPLAGLSDDEWVVPVVLPDGYEVIVAMSLTGSEPSDGQLLVGGDDVDEVSISSSSSGGPRADDAVEEEIAAGEPGGSVETVDIDGVEWQLQTMNDDEGVAIGVALQRVVNGRRVYLSTSGNLDALTQLAAGLEPVADEVFDAPRLSVDSDRYITVASLDDVDVTAQGVNGVYCVTITAQDGTAGRSCGARTEPGTPIVDAVQLTGEDSYAAGVAEPDVASIKFMSANGPSVTVVPTDVSGSFEHRVWVTDQSAATNGRAVITYDDDTTATVERTRAGHWRLADDTGVANAHSPDDSLPWNYTFSDLDGLVAIGDPQVTEYPASDETITLWATDDGVTDGFLVLRDLPARPPTSPEGDVTATAIDVPNGNAWVVVDNVDEDPAPSSATRVMWWRDDGRLWNVSNYNLNPESIAEFARAIDVEPDGSYTLADPAMTLVGTASQDVRGQIRQSWTLDGRNVVLTLTNGGLPTVLNDLPVSQIAEQTIAGQPGYAVTLANGQVNLIWPTDQPGWWMTISSEPGLASRTTDLAAAIVRD